MHKRFDTGKQPYEAAKDTQATAHSQKPLDFVRLSSESTRENPRLLGGTPHDALKYLDNLEPQQFDELKQFVKFQAHWGTEIAKNTYKEGYKIYLQWQKINETGKDEGSSSTKPIEIPNKKYPEKNYTREGAKQAQEPHQYIRKDKARSKEYPREGAKDLYQYPAKESHQYLAKDKASSKEYPNKDYPREIAKDLYQYMRKESHQYLEKDKLSSKEYSDEDYPREIAKLAKEWHLYLAEKSKKK